MTQTPESDNEARNRAIMDLLAIIDYVSGGGHLVPEHKAWLNTAADLAGIMPDARWWLI